MHACDILYDPPGFLCNSSITLHHRPTEFGIRHKDELDFLPDLLI